VCRRMRAGDVLFAHWLTVDRHGLSTLAMTRGRKTINPDYAFFSFEEQQPLPSPIKKTLASPLLLTKATIA